MSTELGDLEQAAACFRKAIDAEPDNMRYHLSRCSLLEQVREEQIKEWQQCTSAKGWALGCVNSLPVARGSQEVIFTQPRAHLLAGLCIWSVNRAA